MATLKFFFYYGNSFKVNALIRLYVNSLRVMLMSMFVIALCKVQTVGFEKLSKAFDSEALSSSSLRSIQRFIADFILDVDLIA